MTFYGLDKDLDKAGLFETENYKKVYSSISLAINSGGIIALTGVVGTGKTTLLRRLQKSLSSDSKIMVSKSLTTDKKKVSISSLYTALFSDLSSDKDLKIPTQTELRERKLQALFRKIKKPVVLFIDEAHQLHWRTFLALKHIIEIIEDCECQLSIVLVGHPILANELKNPRMEEIGARAKLFSLDGIGTNKTKFVEWILKKCSSKETKPHDIVTSEGIELLVSRLITPLQIIHYLNRALEKGFQINEKPITADLITDIISPDINAMEPHLARNGYNIQILCELLNARKSDVAAFFKGQLNPQKTEEFKRDINKLGIVFR